MTRPGGCGAEGNPFDHVAAPKNEDGSDLTPSQLDQAEAQAQAVVQQAVAAHVKDRGDLPGCLKARLQQVMEAQRDWREMLADMVTTVYCRDDWSYRRPRERGDILLTTLRSPAPPRIAFCGDTSGSVSDAELKDICGEILSLIAMYNQSGMAVPLDVIWFDTNAYHQEVWDEDDIEIQGRGGTTFRAAFDKIHELEEQPEAIVFATDGYDSHFGPDPGVPVLWVLTKDSKRDFNPPFGDVVVKHK